MDTQSNIRLEVAIVTICSDDRHEVVRPVLKAPVILLRLQPEVGVIRRRHDDIG